MFAVLTPSIDATSRHALKTSCEVSHVSILSRSFRFASKFPPSEILSALLTTASSILILPLLLLNELIFKAFYFKPTNKWLIQLCEVANFQLSLQMLRTSINTIFKNRFTHLLLNVTL